MKLPPEADPNFWIGATCVRVHVSHFVSGAIERIITVVSSAGVKTQIADNSHQSTSAFSMQNYALALARVSRKRGATDAMRQVFPQIAQVEQQVAALLPAAEQRGMTVFRRRKARDDLRTNTRRRERVLEDIRRSADVVSEEEVVTAWREGLVEGVHGG